MNKLRSRKLWIAVGSVISILLAEFFGVNVSPETIAGIIVMASSYVFAQGIVDKSVVTAQVKATADIGRIQVEMYAKQLEEQLQMLVSESVIEPSGGLSSVPDTDPYK